MSLDFWNDKNKAKWYQIILDGDNSYKLLTCPLALINQISIQIESSSQIQRFPIFLIHNLEIQIHFLKSNAMFYS